MDMKVDDPRPSPTDVQQRRGLFASADQMQQRVLCSVGRERQCFIHPFSLLHGKNLFQAAHAQQAMACGYVDAVTPALGPIQQPVAVWAEEEGGQAVTCTF